VSARPYSRRSGLLVIVAALILLLFFGRSLCSLLIDYKWWSEMSQVSTWQRMWAYRFLPGFAQWLVLAVVLWIAHSRGMHYSGTSLRAHRRYALFAAGAVLVVSLVLATASIDGWVIARFIGGRGIDSPWHDPVFGRSLIFYFFELPFYTQLTGFLEVCAATGAIVYYVTARVWQVQTRFPDLWASGQLNWEDMRRLGRLETAGRRGDAVARHGLAVESPVDERRCLAGASESRSQVLRATAGSELRPCRAAAAGPRAA